MPELAVAVSLEGIGSEMPVAARNLFVVHIEPRELLTDLVRANFPSQWVADAVLNSQIYRNLIEIAPGLKEFQFLARLQRFAERKASGAPDYDVLLWDAPSSGHFLSTLHSARNFETFLSGPLATAGAELARFFSNAEHVTLLPVTTLEEMAVEETIELCGKLQSEFSLKAEAVLMNLVSPLALADPAKVESLRSTSDPALAFAVDRARTERERAAELAQRITPRRLAIQRARRWSSDLDLLRQIGGALEPLAVSTAI
jgi:anion-transporting  ArsA/GET3 family ATPase